MKHTASVLALLAALGLAGCGKPEPPASEAGSQAPAIETGSQAPAAEATPPAGSGELERLAAEVYVYAYPLVLMDVTRQTMTARAPVNVLQHLRTFPDATFTDVVSPNADTLYSQAWMDLSKEPLVLSLPDTARRYYLMPMLDAWTNVFASPGTRTTGNGKGDFAIVGPRWSGTLPAGLKELKSPTEMAWLIGRTQTNGKTDYGAVNSLQDQYKLVPLSAWGKPEGEAAPATPGPGGEAVIPPAEQVAAMSARTFFTRFASLLSGNPPQTTDGPMVEKMRRLGIEAGQPFQPGAAALQAVEAGAKTAHAGIVQAAKQPTDLKNGWRIGLGNGAFGSDYNLRALVAHRGLGANLSADAVYPAARVDADGKPLHGASKYLLHFDKDKMPPANAFWSVTMYDDRQAFVDNPISRFAIGDRDKLQYNPDGSLDLYIQNESPGVEKDSNWLPAPKDGFNLIMRIYWPKREVLDGSWVPPAVKRTS